MIKDKLFFIMSTKFNPKPYKISIATLNDFQAQNDLGPKVQALSCLLNKLTNCYTLQLILFRKKPLFGLKSVATLKPKFSKDDKKKLTQKKKKKSTLLFLPFLPQQQLQHQHQPPTTTTQAPAGHQIATSEPPSLPSTLVAPRTQITMCPLFKL